RDWSSDVCSSDLGGADEYMVSVAGRADVCVDPGPLGVVDDGAPAGLEHPAAARIDHDQPDRPDVAGEAPAVRGRIAIGRARELVEDLAAVVALADRGQDRIVGALVRRQIAQVLIEPVRGEAAGDAV